jgi:predicted Zn-dependent peptidase
MKINRHILANGLRLIHHQDTSTQMVAINVLYNVGARDEDPKRTGFAHLFEHLMFGGTERVPDFDGIVQKAGGESNAWTNNDITNFYLTVPYQNAEIGFWLEADRMRGIDFSQKSLDNQKQVVIEEFKQRNLNQPYGDVSQLIRELAYKVHPYRWCTIGKDISHIEKANLDDVKTFFSQHYFAANAILAVTGNIDFEKTVELTEKWFASIPTKNAYVRNLPTEPEQHDYRFLQVERNVPLDAIYKVYKMPARNHEDYHCIDLISDLLSNGASSRMFQSLVKNKKIVTDINAYISGDIDAGLFYIKAKPADGVSLQEVDEAIENELQDLIHHPIDEKELEKVKNKYESNKIFSEMNYLNKASNLAYYELIDKAESIDIELDKYRSITNTQVQKIASSLFRKENSSVLYYCATKK